MTEVDKEMQELRREIELLHGENDRLRRDNDDLKKEIARHQGTIDWMRFKLQDAEEKIRRQNWMLMEAQEKVRT